MNIAEWTISGSFHVYSELDKQNFNQTQRRENRTGSGVQMPPQFYACKGKVPTEIAPQKIYTNFILT